jgi:hypothetical protein
MGLVYSISECAFKNVKELQMIQNENSLHGKNSARIRTKTVVKL